MAENNSKDLISNEVLQKATQDILQTVSEHLYDYEPYTNEQIAEIFDLDNVTAKSLSKVINDEYIAKNKVFSNEHTMELLSKTLAEANQYTTEQIANSGKLERKIVTSTSEVIDENILYLILTDSTNNIYTQYMLIDGNATPLGTTQINLNDYLKTIDFNTAIDEYAKKNTVVLQNDVVGDLTTLSSNQVLSTQGVSDELDKKVDKTSIVTSIDSTSTDIQVPSVKSVYNNCVKYNNIKTYTSLDQLGLTTPITVGDIYNAMPDSSLAVIPCNDKATSVTDVPTNFGILTIEKCSTSRFSILYKISLYGSVSANELYIGQLQGSDGSGLTWKRVCTTSVKEVPVTDIKFTSTTNYKPSTNVPLRYTIMNRICYVSGGVYCVSPSSSDTRVYTLPKPKAGYQYCKTMGVASVSNDINTVSMIIGTSGELLLANGVAKGEYRCTFSYTVAEQ